MARFLNWLGWLAVMYGPWRITCGDNPIGRWCLPRAGGHAYADRAGKEG